MKRVPPFHPLLFATFPVLSLYAANTVLIPFDEVWPPLLQVVAATGLLWLILRVVLRTWERAAFAASIAVLSFFSFGPILDVVRQTSWGREYETMDLSQNWWIGWVAVLILACWKWKRLPRWTVPLNAMAVALTLLPIVSIGAAWTQRGDATPAAASAQAKNYRGPKPDIFYVILDGYGRDDVLQREMGMDASFVQGLRKRGFYVAEDSRTNYCQTELSLTSSLNMGFIPDLVDGLDPKSEDRAKLDQRIDRSRVSQMLREYGYGYLAVTTGFPGVHPRSADLVLEGSQGSSLFMAALTERTPIRSDAIIQPAFDIRRDNLRSGIATLGRLGLPASRPRFIFAHILAPHPPFVLGPNGEAIAPKRMYTIVDGSHFMQNGGTLDEYRTGYAGQAKAIGQMVLNAVDEILKRSRVRPIIVIQGDHGPKLHLDQDKLEKTDVNEVFPILNAYLVPDEIRKELYAGISPVNSFRTILRTQFGADLPKLEDRSWYSSWVAPYRFTEVTDRIQPRESVTPAN